MSDTRKNGQSDAERLLKESLFQRNRQLEEANWQLNAIYNIGKSITALLDIGEVLRTLYRELKRLMSVDGFYIASYDARSDALEYQILYKDGQEAVFPSDELRKIPAGDLAYRCARENATIVIDKPCAEINSSAVYACLRTKGRIFGVLCVQSDSIDGYGEHQVKLLDAVSSYVSIALDNATMYRKLDEVSKTVAELANHDSLTGLPNRRLLMELVPKAFANALRNKSKVAVLFLDLDNFKPINDKYGHTAGDDALRIFAGRVLGIIRSADIFARLSGGGDEFIVVMTDLKIDSNAGTLARKIIREVAKPIYIKDEANYIGVSIGVSIYPDDSADAEALIVMADEAMYKVKRAAKNSFAFFNEINIQ